MTVTNVKELQAKTAQLRKMLAQADKALGRTPERARDAQRKREQRAADKNVLVPACADQARRERLEADDEAWLMFYFGPESEVEDPFTYLFTSQQRQMIAAIDHAIEFCGDQALAASRGEGKTTLFERMLLKKTLQGKLSFSVLTAATGSLADNSLDTIKGAIEENPLLLADYPEVCVPVRALENTPSRAHYQTVSGIRHDNGEPYEMVSSRFTWCGQEVIFPNVPGSPSARAIIATRGLDSAIRGLKRKGRRVQLVGIDDPDTEETARSSEQAKKLETRIDRALGGLGGQRRNVARVMLTTLQSRISVSYKYTDPKQKPTFKGRRFPFLVKPPANGHLWDEYVQLRITELQDFAAGITTDEHCRRSHQFYLERRAQMDDGAEVANENRFDPTVLPDGSQVEVSALQHYYNEVARIGPEAVATELDNDPGEESGPIESGITPHRIQKLVNGYPQRTVPPDCIKITRGVDCRKVALHWAVRAWRADGSGFTIDYGVYEVTGTIYGVNDAGTDLALKRAILSFLEESKDYCYTTADGEIRTIDRTLIDAGWRTDAVYAACIEAGLGVAPIMGFGKSAGCVQANFSDTAPTTKERYSSGGKGWFLSLRQENLWLVCADADRWKAWEHDRWMTPVGKPGSMTIFGQPSENPERQSDDERAHHSYARHICNEKETEEPYKGGMRRRWKAKSDNTHWLDASYYANVAASIEGIQVLQPTAPAPVAPRPSRKKVQYL